ncbi:TPA: DUF1566 domain-containing protein [Legionella pneumophila subsp. pneumophila]|nr:DUF1566 domain-containing protein [Legionella pneumophila subsp. pneumophila]
MAASCCHPLNRMQTRSLACIKTPLFNVGGGFANDNYWSSTENDADNAWNQNFNNGNQNNDNKGNNLRVRCVRGFKQSLSHNRRGRLYVRATLL